MKPYTIFLEEKDIAALRLLAKRRDLRPGEYGGALLSKTLHDELARMDPRSIADQPKEAN